MKAENKNEKCGVCGSDYVRYILVDPKGIGKQVFYYCGEICLLKDFLGIPNEKKINLVKLKKLVENIKFYKKPLKAK